jgi:hypothetical protein
MARDFENVITHINELIDNFNLHLRNYQVAKLDMKQINNPKRVLDFENKPFGQYGYPENANMQGVYFFFAFNFQLQTNTCLYVGKASMNNSLGRRLDNYMSTSKENNVVPNYFHYKGNQVISMLTFITFEKEYSFIVPALEEYLIKNWRSDTCGLLNTIGNS